MAAVEGTPFHQQQFSASYKVPINMPTMDSSVPSLPPVTPERPPSSLRRQSPTPPASSSSSGRPSTSSRPSTNERPSSALARGVTITEFAENKVNPEPIVQEEAECLLEDFLSPRKLRDLTGLENLEDVHFLEMKVDTQDTSLGNFGTHLPNLSQLKLSNSLISNIRDLGSSLQNVRVLWMARSGLEGLDGISTMLSLQELYLAYNEICDISPCSMLENLTTLDLEGNNIDDITQVEFLMLCQNLTNLTLEGNPVCVTPNPEEADANYDYRQRVKAIIPHLKLLDDEPAKENQTEAKKTASVFDDDWKLIEELMEEGSVMDCNDSVENTGRPGTAIRPTTGYRPGSALKQIRPGSALRPGSGKRPGSSFGSRLGSARPGSVRPGTAARPTTAARPGSAEALDEDDSSDLTRGDVMCGNPTKALRSRKKIPFPKETEVRRLFAEHQQEPVKPNSHVSIKPERTYDLDSKEDAHLKELFDELKIWKKEYQEKKKAILESKAPQVLRIEHDAAVDLTDSENESIDSDYEDDEVPPHLRGVHYATRNFRSQPSAHQPKIGARPKSGYSPSAARGLQYETSQREKPEEPVDIAALRLQQHNSEENTEASGTVRPPSSLRSQSLGLRREEDTRPVSGPNAPAIPSARFRLGPRTPPKSIDRSNPIVRSSVRSPDQPRVPEGPRAGTAQASLNAFTPLPRIQRKGPLANVELLPSMPTKINK